MGPAMTMIWQFGAIVLAPLTSTADYNAPSFAQTEVRVSADSELRFGTFMVFGRGARTVGVNGTVTDESIVALEGTVPGPAQFTVIYDRGNESGNSGRQTRDIEIEIYISPSQRVRDGGVEGALSNLTTDLPGALRVTEGQPVRISIPNCRTRTCSRTFKVGATLNVDRTYGGASLAIPIPVDAVLISDDRQR